MNFFDKQAWSYDWGSLCSDVGGFMVHKVNVKSNLRYIHTYITINFKGLLLGWSIITFYDGLIEMMKGVQNVFIKVQMKK